MTSHNIFLWLLIHHKSLIFSCSGYVSIHACNNRHILKYWPWPGKQLIAVKQARAHIWRDVTCRDMEVTCGSRSLVMLVYSKTGTQHLIHNGRNYKLTYCKSMNCGVPKWFLWMTLTRISLVCSPSCRALFSRYLWHSIFVVPKPLDTNSLKKEEKGCVGMSQMI